MSNADSSSSLSKALVRIRRKDNDGFAGCGVLINKQFVVTCHHVLKTAIGDDELQLGTVFSSFLPDYPISCREPKLKLVKGYPEKVGDIGSADIEDLALLEIDGELDTDDLLIEIPKPHKETGDCFTVKSSVGSDVSGSECIGVSNQGWLIVKLDNREQIIKQGDSGSAVWNDRLEAVTAMVVARKKDTGICYAIPMFKIMQAFSDHLSPKQASVPDFLADDLSYLNEIKEDITLDLKQCDIFRDQIKHWCGLDGYSENNITKYLISQCESDDFVELITSLRSAFDRASLQLDIDGIREQKRLMQAARGIVSKLVIFTVKQEAVLRIKKSDQKARLLPKMSGSVAAGVAARTLGTRIEYMKHKKGCFEGDSYLSLESGFSDKEKQSGSDMATLLLKKLGEKLVPHIKCDMTNEGERTNCINRINAKIQRAKNNKDPKFQRKYFFILPLNDEELSVSHKSIIDQLSEMVRDVTFFYITSKYADDILMVDDYEIDEALIEYFSTLNEFSEQ